MVVMNALFVEVKMKIEIKESIVAITRWMEKREDESSGEPFFLIRYLFVGAMVLIAVFFVGAMVGYVVEVITSIFDMIVDIVRIIANGITTAIHGGIVK